MDEDRRDEFICEAITPVAGTADVAAMARGEPGLPAEFTWRGDTYRVAGVIKKWKTSGRERGGTEMYLRRHWWRIVTDPPAVMTVYCDRQAKDRSRPKARWWVYTVAPGPEHLPDHD